MHLSKFMKYWMLASFIIAGTSVSLNAQETSHQVKDEETLFSIAQQYQVTVQQLKKWNNLSGNTLSIGQTLIIKKPKSRSSSNTHIVKDEETLFSISQQHDVSIADIRRWNDMQNSTLHIGTRLIIRPPSRPAINSTPAADVKIVSTTDSDGYYTVKSGDTLFRIAQMYNTEEENIRRLNNLSSNNIRVGQKLKIRSIATTDVGAGSNEMSSTKSGAFIRYELKQRMSVTDLLDLFEMSKREFNKLNPDLEAAYFQKGQLVNVLVPAAKNDIQTYDSDNGIHILGTAAASKYRAALKGTTTTNGELYNPMALTAAHSDMAIGSLLFVKNANNQRGVLVRINDRTTDEGLRLSEAAWKALGLAGNSARVTIYRKDK